LRTRVAILSQISGNDFLPVSRNPRTCVFSIVYVQIILGDDIRACLVDVEEIFVFQNR
jgi:hypothetical protein